MEDQFQSQLRTGKIQELKSLWRQTQCTWRESASISVRQHLQRVCRELEDEIKELEQASSK